MNEYSNLLKEFLDYRQGLNFSDKTIVVHHYDIMIFIRFMKDAFDVDEPEMTTKQHIRAWRRNLDNRKNQQGIPVKARTVNRILSSLRTFIKFLSRRGRINASLLDEFEPVKEPKTLPTSVLRHVQVRKIIRKLDTTTIWGRRDRAMFELLYSSGIRSAELTGIDLRDVDFENSVVSVTGKGNKTRVVPVGKTALRHLETYVKAIRPSIVRCKSEKALFLNMKGERMRYHTLRDIVRKHCGVTESGSRVTAHTFRRSCATEMIRGDANLWHVKEILGHETINTLRHYAKLTIVDLKKTHAKCHPREKD